MCKGANFGGSRASLRLFSKLVGEFIDHPLQLIYSHFICIILPLERLIRSPLLLTCAPTLAPLLFLVLGAGPSVVTSLGVLSGLRTRATPRGLLACGASLLLSRFMRSWVCVRRWCLAVARWMMRRAVGWRPVHDIVYCLNEWRIAITGGVVDRVGEGARFYLLTMAEWSARWSEICMWKGKSHAPSLNSIQ